MTLLPPHRAHLRRDRAAATAPPAQPGERPGALGAIHPGLPVASLQKGARQANRGCQATNPIGVFSSSSPLLAPGEKGKGTTPRRAGGRRTRTSWGRGPGSEEPELRKMTTDVNTYPACVHLFTEPAMTTLPPHREHRPATLFSSPPWSPSCDGSTTSRRVAR
jgi:hypothetical protein